MGLSWKWRACLIFWPSTTVKTRMDPRHCFFGGTLINTKWIQRSKYTWLGIIRILIDTYPTFLDRLCHLSYLWPNWRMRPLGDSHSTLQFPLFAKELVVPHIFMLSRPSTTYPMVFPCIHMYSHGFLLVDIMWNPHLCWCVGNKHSFIEYLYIVTLKFK